MHALSRMQQLHEHWCDYQEFHLPTRTMKMLHHSCSRARGSVNAIDQIVCVIVRDAARLVQYM